MLKWLVFLPLLVASSVADIQDMGNFTCQANTCSTVKCPTVDSCSNGKLMYSPDHPCSCCKLCVDFIKENQDCNVFSSDKECGPGLSCTLINVDNHKCRPKDTACRKAQSEYDEKKLSGTIGMYVPRPVCDINGDFVGKKCQPDSSCYCIDKNNQRIYGEAPPSDASNMDCKCSRDYQKVLNFGFPSLQFPHCLPNGNYDELQCVNLACYCINPANLTISSYWAPIFDIEKLPCFINNNDSWDIISNIDLMTLMENHFGYYHKQEIHFHNYVRPCEVEKNRIETLRASYDNHTTILGLDSPQCSPDGYFQPVRKIGNSIYCVDPLGRKIENYEIPDSSSTSNCACARTRYLLLNQHISRPQCHADGSYKSFQCRGGVCFCVDPATGDMEEDKLEVLSSEVASLSCYQ